MSVRSAIPTLLLRLRCSGSRLKDTAKVDAAKKLWGEADKAMKAGDEAACVEKINAAMTGAGIKRAQ